MTTLDWWVIGGYLCALLALAAWLGRRQSSEEDYYLAGQDLPPAALATSILATQCSTNSLLGAPAFVGFTLGGGLIWLQYELAVPLAMLGLAFLFPLIYRARVISIYEFLEQRLGRGVRLTASACFLFFRGVATGVTVYGVASVLSLVTGLDYLWSVLLFMGVTIAYDVMGGMRAVVVSDVLQMMLLVAAVLLSLICLWPYMAQEGPALAARSETLLWDWGLSGDSNFGFGPMLFGGLFLYMAYYGCDQSQAQRLLAAPNESALNRILLYNGLLRFPLVAAYCLLGLGLAAYAVQQPEFLSSLPLTDTGSPNVNLAFPNFVLREFAPGLVGLVIVGLFAAAMSSIDSSLNSLSASTVEDFMTSPGQGTGSKTIAMSRLVTLCWGMFAVAFSFTVEHIAGTILEAINKVGSMANGPLLALFVLAALRPGMGPAAVLSGFVSGLLVNALLWIVAPQVSWLWWNVSGFFVSLAVTHGLAVVTPSSRLEASAAMDSASTAVPSPPRRLKLTLVAAFLLMLGVLGLNSLRFV